MKPEEKLGHEIIRLLNLKVKKNGRVDTDGGDKTPLGLGRTIIGCVEKHLEVKIKHDETY